ncbi:MAG: M48 family metallopeptidase [Gammaproteobacteria bacterium]
MSGRFVWLNAVSVALLMLLTGNPLWAQESPVNLDIPAGARSGVDFDVDRATDAYVALLSEEQRAKSDAYMEGGYWLDLWGFLYGLAVAWLLLHFRISAAIRDLAERIGKWNWLHTLAYAVQYIVITTILVFPLSLYQGFFREHKYELATQNFAGWFGDQMTGLMVGAILGSLALLLIYTVIRKAGRLWWIWASVASVAFIFFTSFIGPVYVAPLFNDYQTLEDGPIREQIMSMARANDIPADDVYWIDASRQTSRISANVSGFLSTTRISLNDNLLERTSPEEIQAVMGHEMGHYILNHGVKLVMQFGLVLAGGFAFVNWGFGRALARWGENWGVRDIGDTAGLPLLGAVLSVYFLVMTPLSNSIVRVAEVEADNYGLNVAGQPDGFARVAIRLSEYRKISPGAFEEFLFYDHPSGRNRVHMAMQWKAEHQDSEPETKQE